MWNKAIFLLLCVSLGVCIILFSVLVKNKAWTKDLEALNEIPALRKNGIHIKNEQQLLSKLNEIIYCGHRRMHIVTDFDNTLTVDSGLSGRPVLNSFEMFRKCPSIPQWYKDEDYKLYLRYGPIENDPHLSIEEKSVSNVEWYTAALNLMNGLKFPRQELKDIARNFTGSFRDRIHELFAWVDNNKVPFIVVSSGLGEALLDTLQAANLSSPYLKVASNFIQVDSEDIIIGIKDPIIHSLNKKASAKLAEFNGELNDRTNVVLMGDVIADSYMVDKSGGSNSCDVGIKIGYLSTKRLPLLSYYLDAFDIVIANDQTMDVIIDLLNLIK